jgi:DHA3 family macrolide efflux protein-like MFS transporter
VAPAAPSGFGARCLAKPLILVAFAGSADENQTLAHGIGTHGGWCTLGLSLCPSQDPVARHRAPYPLPRSPTAAPKSTQALGPRMLQGAPTAGSPGSYKARQRPLGGPFAAEISDSSSWKTLAAVVHMHPCDLAQAARLCSLGEGGVGLNLLWVHRDFRRLWIGQLLSQLGNAVFYVMGLWEIQLHSAFLLSVAGLATSIPVALAAVGGVVVDRYHPLRLMMATDVVRGAAVGLGLLALLVPSSLPWVIIALFLVNSLGASLFAPAESVVLPRLVPDADLPAANGMYSLTSLLSGAVGSALGGAAVAAIGLFWIFGLDMASFWASAAALKLVFRSMGSTWSPPAPSALGEPHMGWTAQVREGWQALQGFGWLWRLLPLILLANFAYQAGFTMLPYWSRIQLHASVVGFGLVEGSWAAGMVVGSLLVGSFQRWPLTRALAGVGALQALLVGGFALSSWLPVSMGLLLAAGIANGITNALVFTLFQRAIPEHVRGRAFGLVISMFTLMNPLGSVAAGAFLHVLPLSWTWLTGSLAGLALVPLLWTTPIPATLVDKSPGTMPGPPALPQAPEGDPGLAGPPLPERPA